MLDSIQSKPVNAKQSIDSSEAEKSSRSTTDRWSDISALVTMQSRVQSAGKTVSDTPGVDYGYYVPGKDQLVATEQDKESFSRKQNGTANDVTITDLDKYESRTKELTQRGTQGLIQEIADSFKRKAEPKQINYGSVLPASRVRELTGRASTNHDVNGEDFFDVLQKNHGTMDANQDGKLELGELKDYVKRGDVDAHAREVGSVLVDHFDEIKKMHEGHMPYFYGTHNNVRPYFQMFDRNNYVSPEDLTVLRYAISGSPLPHAGWKNYENFKVGTGTFEVAGGGAAIAAATAIGAFASAPLVVAGLAVAGVGLIAHGIYNAGIPHTGLQGQSFKAALTEVKSENKIGKQHEQVRAWNYFSIRREIDGFSSTPKFK
jgi:Ca2+-binding EF-hand superfamily protein